MWSDDIKPAEPANTVLFLNLFLTQTGFKLYNSLLKNFYFPMITL